MLYDEKGGRLDSIHIKAQDIVLGEQLESDRYYILVEMEKTASKSTEGVQIVCNPKVTLEEKPLSQKGNHSQARCAGLKRKKTGFIPPRLIKQARHEEVEVHERSSLTLKNKICTSQNESMSCLQQASSIDSSYRQEHSEGNNFPNSSPMALKNVSLHSRDNLYEKDLGPSSPTPVNSPTLDRPQSISPAISLSPWSVYGSKNSKSPKTYTPVSDHAENSKNKSPDTDEMQNKILTNHFERTEMSRMLNKTSKEVSKDRTNVGNKGLTNRPTTNSMQHIMNLLKNNKEKKFNGDTRQNWDITKKFNGDTRQNFDIKNDKFAIESKDRNFMPGGLDLFSDQSCAIKIKDSKGENNLNSHKIDCQKFDTERMQNLDSFHSDPGESKIISNIGKTCDENGKIQERTEYKQDALQSSNSHVTKDLNLGISIQDHNPYGISKIENELDKNESYLETTITCDKAVHGSNDEMYSEDDTRRNSNSDIIGIEETSEGWFGLTFSPLSHASISDSEQDDDNMKVKISQQSSAVNTSQQNTVVETSQPNGIITNYPLDTNPAQSGPEQHKLVFAIDEGENKAEEDSVRSFLLDEQQVESKIEKNLDNYEISEVEKDTAIQISNHDPLRLVCSNADMKQTSNFTDDIELTKSEQEDKDKIDVTELNIQKRMLLEHKTSDVGVLDSFKLDKKICDKVYVSSVLDFTQKKRSVVNLDSITIEEDPIHDKKSSIDITVDGQEERTHTDSHISRSSQDTMDFSCDTLCDESQNYLSQDLLDDKIRHKSQQADLKQKTVVNETCLKSFLVKAENTDYIEEILNRDQRFLNTEYGNDKLYHVCDDRIMYKNGKVEQGFQSKIRDVSVTNIGTSDNEDELYGQLYNEPRLMYPDNEERKCKGLTPIVSSTVKKHSYLSSLQRYKSELLDCKQPKQDILEEQCRNPMIKKKDPFKNESSINSELSGSSSIKSVDSSINCLFEEKIYQQAEERQSSENEVKSVNNGGNTGSKWDQYVPEQNEEEIDLTKFKRKETINKDFSVVVSTFKVDQLRGLEQSGPLLVSQDSDMCPRNEVNDLNKHANLLLKDESVQQWSDSEAFYKGLSNSSGIDEVVVEVPGSLSSIDSQDFLYAVEGGEKSLLEKTHESNEENQARTKEIRHCNSESKSEQPGDEFENNENSICIGRDNVNLDVPRENRSLNCGDDVERAIANKLPENRKSSSDDSLNLSLSFEEQPISFVPAKPISNHLAPSLRGGWKPPVQKLDCTNLGSQTKSDKRSYRFLKILQHSNTLCAFDSDSFEEEKNNNKSPDDSYDKIHIKNENTTIDASENLKAHSKVKEIKIHAAVNRLSQKNINRMGFKSPILTSQGHTDAEGQDRKSQQSKSCKFRQPGMLSTKSPSTTLQPLRRQFDCPTSQANQILGPKLNCTELYFPSRDLVEFSQTITRQVVIQDSFSSVHHYKQVLTAAVIENLNSILFDISTRYHQALSRIDTSMYEKSAHRGSASSVSVQCKCGSAAKLLSVRKEGPNKGRQFYGCGKNTQQRCKFFQWVDGKVSNFNSGPGNQRKICDGNSLGLYMKDQHVHFYPECQLLRKTKENIIPFFKRPKWARGQHEDDTVHKKQLFLKLPRKGHSSLYAKDDIWVISKDLDFHPTKTFVACSTFYGPLSSNEVEIDPLYGFSPSNWSSEVVCHGLLAGNASTELSCLENIREHLSTQSPPVLPFLLNRKREHKNDSSVNGFSVPRLISSSPKIGLELVKKDVMDDIVCRYINEYGLNTDQTEALRRVSGMFCREKSVDNVLLLHGVFGAGKSFLLSVMVLFLVEIFKIISNSSMSGTNQVTWKLLISSTTNVAVDRILQGVLNLGFEDFIRVGSVKKIAKPILPFSIHASGTDNQELKDLQEMLRSSDLTPSEKSHVRQSIEKHRQGENKKKLGAVRVVGVTCASCSVHSLNNMQFPVVFLDECSQMTEPSSLLPIARFGCQKLLLVGDPKQLDPTIEGAKPGHDQGLEQTLFDRMIKMGSIPTILKTQYRCHPWISAISNQLFYGDILYNGVTEMQRQPLLNILPTICFYDVDRGQECCERGGSFYNEHEAQFVVFLLQVMTSAGIESSSIGVITLYKSQMSRIMDLITMTGDDQRLKGVQVSTVDAFQGGERDIIILSCVRTQACGFIDNDKRTNVALTRAKHHLLIVGNYRNLSSNFVWGKVLEHCKGHKDGLQCAEDAQQQLEIYIQNLDSQRSSIEDESTLSIDKTKQSKTKGSKNRHPRKRKRQITSLRSCELDSQEIGSTGSSMKSTDFQNKIGANSSDLTDNSGLVVSGEIEKQFVDDVDSCDEVEATSLVPVGGKRPGSPPKLIKPRARQKYSDRLRLNWSEDELQGDSDEDFPVFKI